MHKSKHKTIPKKETHIFVLTQKKIHRKYSDHCHLQIHDNKKIVA